MKTYMAIGGHIGDAELTGGLFLATKACEGDRIVTVALTGGEKGNPPHIDQKTYRIQKEKEANDFAKMLGGEAVVFPYADGELAYSEEVVIQVAELIRKYRPSAILTHWKHSMHKDHVLTSRIVKEAQFYASIDYGTKVKGERCWAPVYYAENWEDSEKFDPYMLVKCSEEGFKLWSEALHTQWFVMNSSSFKYYDYYTHLARVRGCLARCQYAIAVDIDEHAKYVVKESL